MIEERVTVKRAARMLGVEPKLIYEAIDARKIDAEPAGSRGLTLLLSDVTERLNRQFGKRWRRAERAAFLAYHA